MSTVKKRKRNKGRILKAVLTVLLVYAVIVAAAAYFYDGKHAEIEMSGSPEVTVEYGQVYADAGAWAYTTGRLFDGEELELSTEGVERIGDVGDYKVTYSCEFKKKTVTAERTVHVVDTVPPKLELVPDGKFNARLSTGFEEPGYSAWDNHDGDITASVICEIGDNIVRYTVYDSSGNSATATREIVYAPTEPTVMLDGGERVEITACISWQDPGYSAYDGTGGEVTDEVKVEVTSVNGEEVNGKDSKKKTEFTPYLPGTYVLTYSLEMENGKKPVKVQAQRTVTVKPVEIPESVTPPNKTIYLTFDDGPGPYTEELLDVLKKYDVKVTFFVTAQNEDYLYLLKREHDEGHTVAVHTYSHDCYSHSDTDIYSSVEAYYDDFMKMRQLIYDYTGEYTDLFRFPGGSSNTISSFTPGIMTVLTQAMPAMGFKYFDWNCSSGDAGSYKYSSKKIFEMATTGAEGIESAINAYGAAVLLQHDIKDFSVGAVEDIIKWGLKNGYEFAALDMTSPRARHPVYN